MHAAHYWATVQTESPSWRKIKRVIDIEEKGGGTSQQTETIALQHATVSSSVISLFF